MPGAHPCSSSLTGVSACGRDRCFVCALSAAAPFCPFLVRIHACVCSCHVVFSLCGPASRQIRTRIALADDGVQAVPHISRALTGREAKGERERRGQRDGEKAAHTSAWASTSLSVARFGDGPAGASRIFIPSSRARALLSPKPAACSSKVLAWATLRSTSSPATHAGAKAAVT